jgi:hypothetical protein
MLFDERPIKLANDTEEAVWRFFLRRCGMKRLEARQILKLGHIRKYAAGDVIYDREVPGSTLALGLVVEVRLRVCLYPPLCMLVCPIYPPQRMQQNTSAAYIQRCQAHCTTSSLHKAKRVLIGVPLLPHIRHPQGRANLRVRVNGNAKAGPTSLTSFTAVEAKGRSPHNKLGAPEYERYVCSGELTGMRMLNLFGIYVGFEALEVLAAPA